MSKIEINELQKQLDNIFVEYGDHIDDIVQKETDSNIEKAKAELKSLSPTSSKPVSTGVGKIQLPGTYRNGWHVVSKKDKHLYTKVIANRVYQLTHLLEFGHATRNGGQTKKFPHIRQTEDKYQVKLIEGITQDIERGV